MRAKRSGPDRAVSRTLGDLVVVSHVAHHDWRGRLWAYAPYARELEVWADLFPRLLIAAPTKAGPPPGDSAAIDRKNVHLLPQQASGGDSLGAKARQLVMLPRLVRDLSRALRGAGAVHVRCPGNLGLLGVVLAPLFCRRLVAKYAGQWGTYPGEAWSFRLQRALLRSPWWRGPVTVYGDWPKQPAKVTPFFTSVLDDAHVTRARTTIEHARVPGPLRVLFVGRLSAAKNVDALIRALATLKARGIAAEATILGDGPERSSLEALASEQDVAAQVHFAGGVDFEDVLEAYARHDALVLVSETEGWPKAITEAMAFGLLCLGSNRGLVPTILEDRGVVMEPGDDEALAKHLGALATRPDAFRAQRLAAAAWGQRYTLSHLRTALGDLLAEAWQVPREAFGDQNSKRRPPSTSG